MSIYRKHFTLPEARRALPDLRRRLLRINDLIAEIETYEKRTGGPFTVILRGNGKGPVITGAGEMRDEAQRLIEAIASEGILIKDVRGLADFPHFLDGDPAREVLLCWQLGEDTIEYWHDIETGFAGRTRLS
ncbi:MAG: DUF2203 domain-containing protein [Capsulimonadaceae bacterium]